MHNSPANVSSCADAASQDQFLSVIVMAASARDKQGLYRSISRLSVC